MLVCKLPLYHIIMRCLGYQQISRRLGREGCSTIRKCQLAASSFCRSLNPIFLTCISATGTGPLHSDKPPGEPQREHCYGDPTALLSQCPETPAGPQAELQPSHRPRLPALPTGLRVGQQGWGGSAPRHPHRHQHSRATENTFWGTRRVRARVHVCTEGTDREGSQANVARRGRCSWGMQGTPRGHPRDQGCHCWVPAAGCAGSTVGLRHQQGDTACVCAGDTGTEGTDGTASWRVLIARHRRVRGAPTRVSWGATRSCTGPQGPQERGNGGGDRPWPGDAQAQAVFLPPGWSRGCNEQERLVSTELRGLAEGSAGDTSCVGQAGAEQ